MKMDQVELSKPDGEYMKRIGKVLDDYRESVKEDYERPVFLAPRCTCCPVHYRPDEDVLLERKQRAFTTWMHSGADTPWGDADD